jgi:hypothetical protein
LAKKNFNPPCVFLDSLKLTGKDLFTFGSPHGLSKGTHADEAGKTPRRGEEMANQQTGDERFCPIKP